MKKRISLFLCFVMLFVCASAVQASGLTIAKDEDALEEDFQFPFLAETDELAVNVRAQPSTQSAKVGRLERGTQLTVTGAEVGKSGELFYCVLLEDGTQGFIRSDLLIEADIAEAQRAENPEPAASEYQLIGNKKTKKYHEPSCRSLPAEKNQVFFESADEAESKGYAHCKNCD
ncbi:MAG: SH3 domain-containing protein [Clostridia bacterium]|nr:SH3 domain-containing protein [Clostridia bacterium]